MELWIILAVVSMTCSGCQISSRLPCKAGGYCDNVNNISWGKKSVVALDIVGKYSCSRPGSRNNKSRFMVWETAVFEKLPIDVSLQCACVINDSSKCSTNVLWE